MTRSILSTGPLFVLLLLAACTPPPATPAPAPTQTPTATFDLDLEADASLQSSASPGEWLVTGLARSGASDVIRPRLSFVLVDGAGVELERRTVDLQPDPLPARSSWPFLETFTLAGTPSAVEVRLQGEIGGSGQRPMVQGEVLRTFLDDQGRPVALGALSNDGTRQAFISALRLVGRGASGAIQEVLDGAPARRQLAPGEVTPFLAPLPPDGDSLDWEAYVLTAFGDGSTPGIEVVEVRSDSDDQGHPFVTAVLRNVSAEPRSPTVTAILMQEEAWLAGESFDRPVVLAPGERAAVSLRVPGRDLGPEEAIDWLVVADSTVAAAGPVPVASEVIDFEPLGSTLVLGVRLTAGARPVHRPAAQASLVGEDGAILSAAWAIGPDVLPPGESTVVPLAMPLPRGFDLTLGQLDVRAAGLP